MGLVNKTDTYATGLMIDYTPSGADAAAGVPVQIAGIVGVPAQAISDGTKGALAVAGHFKGALADDTVAAGDVIGWDADGDPYGGTAGSGCYTNESGDWDFRVGTALAAATATSGEVIFALNVFPNANVYQNAAANVAAAAALNLADITDNSGGVDPGDDTIAVITPAAAITDNSGGSDPGDDTIAEIADIALDTSNTYTDAAVNGAVNTAIGDVSDAVAQLAAKQNTTSTAITAVMAAVAQIAAKMNDVGDDLAEIRTQLNAEIAALKTAGLQASS